MYKGTAESPPRPQPRKRTPSDTRTRGLYSLLFPIIPFLDLYTSNNLINVRLYHNASNNHLSQYGVHGLVAKDKVQFADILEDAV